MTFNASSPICFQPVDFDDTDILEECIKCIQNQVSTSFWQQNILRLPVWMNFKFQPIVLPPINRLFPRVVPPPMVWQNSRQRVTFVPIWPTAVCSGLLTSPTGTRDFTDTMPSTVLRQPRVSLVTDRRFAEPRREGSAAPGGDIQTARSEPQAVSVRIRRYICWSQQ